MEKERYEIIKRATYLVGYEAVSNRVSKEEFDEAVVLIKKELDEDRNAKVEEILKENNIVL